MSTCIAIGSRQGILEEPVLSEEDLVGRKTSEEADVEAERVSRGQKAGFPLGSLAHTPLGRGSTIHPFGKASVCFFDQEQTVICIHTDVCQGHLVAKGCRGEEEMAFMGMTGNKSSDWQLAFELGSKHELALCCPKESWQGEGT